MQAGRDLQRSQDGLRRTGQANHMFGIPEGSQRDIDQWPLRTGAGGFVMSAEPAQSHCRRHAPSEVFVATAGYVVHVAAVLFGIGRAQLESVVPAQRHCGEHLVAYRPARFRFK